MRVLRVLSPGMRFLLCICILVSGIFVYLYLQLQYVCVCVCVCVPGEFFAGQSQSVCLALGNSIIGTGCVDVYLRVCGMNRMNVQQ